MCASAYRSVGSNGTTTVLHGDAQRTVNHGNVAPCFDMRDIMNRGVNVLVSVPFAATVMAECHTLKGWTYLYYWIIAPGVAQVNGSRSFQVDHSCIRARAIISPTCI